MLLVGSLIVQWCRRYYGTYSGRKTRAPSSSVTLWTSLHSVVKSASRQFSFSVPSRSIAFADATRFNYVLFSCGISVVAYVFVMFFFYCCSSYIASSAFTHCKCTSYILEFTVYIEWNFPQTRLDRNKIVNEFGGSKLEPKASTFYQD